MGLSCSGVMPLSKWLQRKLGGTYAFLGYGDMRKGSNIHGAAQQALLIDRWGKKIKDIGKC